MLVSMLFPHFPHFPYSVIPYLSPCITYSLMMVAAQPVALGFEVFTLAGISPYTELLIAEQRLKS